jgi:hypothetical protein
VLPVTEAASVTNISDQLRTKHCKHGTLLSALLCGASQAAESEVDPQHVYYNCMIVVAVMPYTKNNYPPSLGDEHTIITDLLHCPKIIML